MTAFAVKQREALEALAAPAVPGESVKALFARIARKAGITRSKAEKAWRGYTVLRADEWDRVQAACGVAEHDARNEYAELFREIETIGRRLAALEANAARAVAREGGRAG